MSVNPTLNWQHIEEGGWNTIYISKCAMGEYIVEVTSESCGVDGPHGAGITLTTKEAREMAEWILSHT